MSVEGALAAALVDSNSGLVLGKMSDGFDMSAAGADSAQLARTKVNSVKALSHDDSLEDILITMGEQYHIIRPVEREPDLFLYLILDRARSNLAMARLFTANAGTEIFA